MDAVVPRPGGASGNSDVSRRPANAAPNVLGIGVADSVRTSTSTQAALKRSFCRTPNLCSSSTTARPRLRHGCRGDRRACVPTHTSQAPEATAARTRLASCLGLGWPSSTVSPGRGATNSSTETLSGPSLLLKTFKCCLANTVVGARTATCRPPRTASSAARMAISVFPKPTSPNTNRSIGASLLHKSSSTSSQQRRCPAVMSKPRPASNKASSAAVNASSGWRSLAERAAAIVSNSRAWSREAASARSRFRCHTSGRAHLDKVGGFWEGGTRAFDRVGVATSDLTGPPRSTTSSDPRNLVRRAASACSRATVLSANRNKIGGSLDEESCSPWTRPAYLATPRS
mmetsp:Transcript_1028/g.3060  ORF Transcript_1028/g.3060 Transcript_1028/m.3060 type:complete len:344 (+) Transcript_1028:1253-2284(+)